MPPFDCSTKDLLKAVLAGKKKLLKMKDVNFCNPPAFDEIGVKALYEKIIKLPGMAAYFPDSLPKGRQMQKSYMYNVWNTLHPQDVKAVIDYANSQRYSISNEEVKQDTIVITEEWHQELQSMPFVSKQKGRMSHLLKQKSKVAAVPKKRKEYGAFDFMKRRRDSEGKVQQVPAAGEQPKQASSIGQGNKKVQPKILDKFDDPMNNK